MTYATPIQAAAALGVLAVRARRDASSSAAHPLHPHQRPPGGEWDVWLLLAGRGAGKTEAGARYVDQHASGPACIGGSVPHRIAVVAPSHDDAVDTCVRGESGLLRTNPAIRFHPGAMLKSDLTWPGGAEAQLFGTFAPEDVERFRGPQHCLVWGDEFAAWRKLDEAWDMIQFGLRLGPHPRMVLTTTPKRRGRLRSVMADPRTAVVRASTRDNPSLPADRRERLYAMYGGTTIGRQELDAEVIDDVAGALWSREMIDASRIASAPDMVRVVVAIDPSATSTESADEAGIIAAGVNWAGHGYILSDESLRASPASWARAAVAAYQRLRADRIVAEVNNGGEMVEAVVRGVALDMGVHVAYSAVTASRGKQTRAEPISALYEQGRVHHVGAFPELEDQMCTWVPGERSPDRMDAAVWALTDLMVHADNPWAGLQRAGGVA